MDFGYWKEGSFHRYSADQIKISKNGDAGGLTVKDGEPEFSETESPFRMVRAFKIWFLAYFCRKHMQLIIRVLNYI